MPKAAKLLVKNSENKCEWNENLGKVASRQKIPAKSERESRRNYRKQLLFASSVMSLHKFLRGENPGRHVECCDKFFT